MAKKSILFFKIQKNLKNKIDFTDFSTIIPVDYDSSKFLDSQKIPYSLPENYVALKEYYEIDHNAVQLVKNLWMSKTTDLIFHKEINLLKIYEFDIVLSLIKLMKTIYEYNKIITKINPDKIFSSLEGSLFSDIPKFLSNKYNINYESFEIRHSSEFFLDKIPIQFKFANKIISINSSKFENIKKISEKFSKLIPKKKTNQKKILLIDFNVVLYQYFIDELESNGFTVILINSRKPIIHNIDSLKIQLSKRYHTEFISDYVDNEIKEKIKIYTEKFEQNFNTLFSSSDFKAKFVMDNLNFYDLIFDYIKNYFFSKLSNSILQIESGLKILEENFSCILFWNYNLPFEKIMMDLAFQKSIPIMILQDGIRDTAEHPLLGPLPNIADHDDKFNKFFCWGKLPQDYYLRSGIPKNKIVLTGSPIYDEIFKKRIEQKETNNILLATSGLSIFLQNNTIGYVRKYRDTIELICKTMKKFPKKNLIVKLHPFANEEFDIASFVKEIDPKIQIFKNENIQDLISNSDLVISGYSTVILQSMVLGKPTMVYRLWGDYEPSNLPFVGSNSSMNLDYSHLESQLQNFFTDKSIKEELIHNSKKFLNNYLSFQGKSSENITSILNEF